MRRHAIEEARMDFSGANLPVALSLAAVGLTTSGTVSTLGRCGCRVRPGVTNALAGFQRTCRRFMAKFGTPTKWRRTLSRMTFPCMLRSTASRLKHDAARDPIYCLLHAGAWVPRPRARSPSTRATGCGAEVSRCLAMRGPCGGETVPCTADWKPNEAIRHQRRGW